MFQYSLHHLLLKFKVQIEQPQTSWRYKLAIKMHPIKFTSKLKSLYQKNEEFKQGKKMTCSLLHVYTCDIENADEVLNGGYRIPQWRTER